ncbi:MAG: hypothetical protein KDM63_06075 [Verrucomicrobiae bacterium]|nr:hypothetical protein [Verrucomicrobiae bacterium]
MKWIISVIVGFAIIEQGRGDENKPPFSVHLSPNKSHISVGDDPRSFFVIFRNISTVEQKVFEQWNSWGYRNISFEISEGKRRYNLILKPQSFTRNFPSIYLVPPGENMVFRFTFDSNWENLPELPNGETEVSINVIYKCTASDESKKQGVWAGKIRSDEYKQKLWSYRKQ